MDDRLVFLHPFARPLGASAFSSVLLQLLFAQCHRRRASLVSGCALCHNLRVWWLPILWWTVRALLCPQTALVPILQVTLASCSPPSPPFLPIRMRFGFKSPT